MSARQEFFQAGGTLSEDAPSYIERPADRDLLHALEQGELCLLLAPRQTGKSSLMVHSMARLKGIGIRAGIVDLQPLGSHREMDAWFRDVVYQIERTLRLRADSIEWWEAHPRLGATQRFMTFMEDVVLAEIETRVVIFFDEIDSVLSLPFSDDFFTTIRAMVNARASNPVLRRLNFVLLGVATPSEFIRKRSRTPFNIGKRIEPGDFDTASMSTFKEALGAEGGPLVDRILDWTAGQPLLVQKLAEDVHSMPDANRTVEGVDEEVQRSYLGARIDKDTHLKFIRDYLLEDNKKVRRTLRTYESVLKGEEVTYDDRSPVHSRLKLAGVVRVEDGKLAPRNRIYGEVFDKEWARKNTPRNVTKIVAYGATSALLIVLMWFFLVQPIFFPKFTRFFPDESIYYTDRSDLALDLRMPSLEIERVTVEGHEVPLGKKSDVEMERAIQIPLADLPVGESRHQVRCYGGLWKENFETRLLVVSYPMAHWKPLTDLEMVEVPGGCFDMGCGDWAIEAGKECPEDERPVHRVCLDAFRIGRHEVTQDQWVKIMGYNPSSFEKGGRYPVESVNWNHVQEFIQRLNKLGRGRFRLPTEAEWEYAARSGGKNEIYSGGDDPGAVAWYTENSNGETHPVGLKAPNGFGLFDMSGNVWEWCSDWYESAYYKESPGNNPKGPERGKYNIVRGGAWNDGPRWLRVSGRGRNGPVFRYFNLGFRCAQDCK